MRWPKWAPDFAFAAASLVFVVVFGAWGVGSFHSYRADLAAEWTAIDRQIESEAQICSEPPSTNSEACATTLSSTKLGLADLRAQQEMAQWAYAMVLATLTGVVITALGLVYVVRAFRLNASATEHAARAADAAAAANAQSTELARAYVCILSAEISVESGLPESITICIKNVGQTLARKVDVRDHAFFGPPDATEAPGELESEGLVDMAPGQEATKVAHSFDSGSRAIAAAQLAMGAKGAFFYFGRIDYVDLAGRAQWTTFRFKASPDANGIFRDGPMSLCRDGNAAS